MSNLPRRASSWCALACAALCSLAARPSAAWNQSGHMQIAAYAYDQLPALTQRRLLGVLRQHPRFNQDFQALLPAELTNDADRARWLFLWAAVWPDTLRRERAYERRTWHYVDFPLRIEQGKLISCGAARAALPELQAKQAAQHAARATHERPHTDAPGASESDPGANLTPTGIEEIRPAFAWARRTLADPAAPGPTRALALSWLLHLVGDAHMPLHAVSLFSEQRFPTGDRGGNDITVHGRGALHHVWDDALGEAVALADVEREANGWRKTPELLQLGRAAAQQLDLERWLDEDCALAESAVYTPPVLAAIQATEREHDSAKPDIDLPPSYFERATSAARRRAVQAGARLAAMLEALKLPDAAASAPSHEQTAR